MTWMLWLKWCIILIANVSPLNIYQEVYNVLEWRPHQALLTENALVGDEDYTLDIPWDACVILQNVETYTHIAYDLAKELTGIYFSEHQRK